MSSGSLASARCDAVASWTLHRMAQHRTSRGWHAVHPRCPVRIASYYSQYKYTDSVDEVSRWFGCRAVLLLLRLRITLLHARSDVRW